MKQEEPEVSDELKELKSLSAEMEQHSTRLAVLQAKGALTDKMVAAEIASTVMPLLADLAKAQLNHGAFMEDWIASIEEEGGGNAPDLSDEEIELFGFLLARLREFVQSMKAAPDMPPEARQGFLEIEVKLGIGDKILERLTADEEEESGETDEDAEGGGEPQEGDPEDDPADAE